MKLFLFFLFFLPLLLNGKVFSDENKYSVVKNWQINDGLPQNTVFSVIQDRDGYIWLGTAEGIARFDGVKFTLFNNKSNQKISFDSTRALFQDSSGNVWIGGNNILKYKDRTFTKKIIDNDNNKNSELIRTFYEDSQGRIWIGTYGNGVKRIEGNKITTLSTASGFIDDTILAFLEDSKGQFWIGTSKGLCLFNKGKCKLYTKKEGLSGNIIRTIFEDKEQNLWIGTQTGGITLFKKNTIVHYNEKTGLSNNWVSSIVEDAYGTIIIGTFGGGINFIKNDEIFKNEDINEHLPDLNITTLMLDRENNLWAGTWKEGVVQLRVTKFSNHTANKMLTLFPPIVLFEDSKKNVWAGTRNKGIFLFQNGKFIRNFTTFDGLASNIINTIYEDKNGNIIASSDAEKKQSGLSILNGDHFQTIAVPEILSGGDISSVIKTEDGMLWLGTYNHALVSVKDNNIKQYGSKELDGRIIRTMILDQKKTIWIGASGKKGGLISFDGKKFTIFTEKDGLSNSTVLSIYEDKDQNLWIGTKGGGLNLYKEGKFTSLSEKEGLFDNKVFSILEDSSGYLWMSSNKGIFKVKKTKILDFAKEKTKFIQSISYDTLDGMKSRECNGGFHPSALKLSTGELLFPTIKGIVSVLPDKDYLNTTVPPVLIEKITADGKEILPASTKELEASTKNMEIEYTALSFSVPEKVNFKYKLEGVDKEWINAGSRRVAYYNNLPYGNFTFKVKAANNDNVWNNKGASFSFKRKPFFYQTIWFRVCFILILVLIIWIIFKLRLKKINKQKKLLEILVLEKAQELNATVEELTELKDELKEKYKTSTIDNQLSVAYANQLINFMEKEKPFLDESLSVKILAEKINISPHHLSQVINSEFNQNFYTFVNTYRANEVKKELEKPENRNESILIIAYNCGFKSKSSFNIIFKKINGKTPTEYRKDFFIRNSDTN